MISNYLKYSGILIPFIFATGFSANTILRGRNEGTYDISSSNVAGNGNISVFAGTSGGIANNNPTNMSFVGLQLGIAEIMQINGFASVENFKKLGPAEAHLQITTPQNNRLRFFGTAILADLFLSTAQDTISFSSDSSRPFYSPYIMPSVVADFDLFALKKNIPIKTFFSIKLVDNAQLIHRYSQLSLNGGVEWRNIEHSLFIDGGIALYKEKRNKLNPVGDKNYKQMYAWIRPGGRYRLHKRFSIVGGLGFVLFKKLKKSGEISPNLLSLSVRLEAPIVFQETNTEAIRTLMFMKQKKEEEKQTEDQPDTKNNDLLNKFDTIIEEIGDSTTFDYGTENKKLIEQRKHIQKKMAEIEEMLKDEDYNEQ